MGSGKPRSSKQRLFAFWEYDTFPFVLGGEVEEFREDGLVYVEAYQRCFRPIKVVVYAEGQKLWALLDELREEYRQAIDDTNKKFKAKAEEIFGGKL